MSTIPKKVNLPSALLHNNSSDTTMDKIKRHLFDPDKFSLTENQAEQLERWMKAYSLSFQFNRRDVAKLLMRFYDGNEGRKKLSEAQAYRDVENAFKVFGDVYGTSKEAHRNFLREYFKDALIRAKARGDHNGEYKIGHLLARIDNLGTDENKHLDFTEMQPTTPVVVINVEVLKMFPDIIDPDMIKEAKLDDSIEDAEVIDEEE